MNGKIGLDRNKVELHDYNTGWIDSYESEAETLKDIFGAELENIDHFGSTSIPGLKAKPVIDILVQVKSGQLDGPLIEKLEQNDYRERVFNDGKERRMFAKGPDESRTHHVHITPAGSGFAKDMLTFRDRLRADQALVREYAELKTELATRHPDDRQAYYRAKRSFMDRVTHG